MEQGADRDKADNNGDTPLHKAAVNGHLGIAMLLMSYGADLNARNNRGYLPIDRARTEEMEQVIRDEPRRRIDETPGKRAIEQDWHSDAAATVTNQQEGELQSNQPPHHEEGEGEVADEDQDSEPSSDEEDEKWHH